MLDSCCELFNHILVFVVAHYRFTEREIRTSAEVLKRRRALIRVVVLEVLHYLEVGVHRHIFFEVLLISAEALRAKHVLGYAVNHHRQPVVDPPVLDLLGRLLPLRYLGRELVLIEIDVPLFAVGPLRQPSLYDDFLALLLLLRGCFRYVFVNDVLFHFLPHFLFIRMRVYFTLPSIIGAA